ncbi:MAG: hypothetical protein LBI03_08760 [Clostridiales bacterium]|jgi:hypothetical protein|nr:hypothetical protein [Clostridiales bacterium]
MKIVVGGKEINLVDRDVKLAKKLVKKFLKTAKEKAEENGAPTFYFTLLTVMYLTAHDHITAVSPETMALLLNAAHANNKRYDPE